jgi:hypothetical protein
VRIPVFKVIIGLCARKEFFMPVPGHDFVNDLESAVAMGAILFVTIILIVFFALRLLWWVRRRGFRPTYWALGNALQELQSTAVPQVQYMLEAEHKEETKEDEDDAGGPDKDHPERAQPLSAHLHQVVPKSVDAMVRRALETERARSEIK